MIDVTARMRALAAQPGGGQFIAAHEPSFWLRNRLVDFRTRCATGEIRPCQNLRAGTVAMLALWSPDRIVCAGCKAQLRLPGDADQTSDRCQQVTEVIHPRIVEAAPGLLVMFNLCPACHHAEVGP